MFVLIVLWLLGGLAFQPPLMEDLWVPKTRFSANQPSNDQYAVEAVPYAYAQTFVAGLLGFIDLGADRVFGIYRSTKWVLTAHLPDQCTKLSFGRGPAATNARSPSPVPAKPISMPSQDRLGSDNQDGLEGGWEQPNQPDEE